MALPAHVQSAHHANGAGATTVAVTVTAVGNGNAVMGVIGWAGAANLLTSVTDNASNPYVIDKTANDSGQSFSFAIFHGLAIASGPVTITGHFSTSVTSATICVDEFSGVISLRAAAINVQDPAPGVGTDAITSKAVLSAASASLIYGGCVSITGGDVLSAGSGFTAGVSIADTYETEYLVPVASGKSIAATFTTASATDVFISAAAMFNSAQPSVRPLAERSAGRGSPYLGLPIGYQQIAVTAATNLTVPAGATYATFQVDTANVRWRDDGTAPTATVGTQMFHGLSPVQYFGNLAAIKFVAVSGSPVLNVVYYR